MNYIEPYLKQTLRYPHYTKIKFCVHSFIFLQLIKTKKPRKKFDKLKISFAGGIHGQGERVAEGQIITPVWMWEG